MKLIRRTDIARVARLLAESLADDPFYRWLVPPDPDRVSVLARRFEAAVETTVERGWAFASSSGQSVLLIEEFEVPVAVSGTVPDAATATGVEPISTVAEAGRLLRATHPRERHTYLDMLATSPQAQGRGEGTALVTALIAGVDRDPRPIHLHSSNQRNLPFYLRRGFVAEPAVRIPGSAVTAVPMTRPKNSPA
ncbi:GNAT family N-acetyltransferase [Luethyella okanaganae]|uniref:GNAT family N-acetyltransferase n=1 Tax=Luethyella okanaganae TaxID=69372 RepID=A0ABW1VFN7_9MICO